jgi:hypothetical protein
MTATHQKELLALILDATDDIPVIGLDPDGTIVRWTPGASSALGHEPTNVLARHVSE